ncbi:MAG: nucleotide exchange factor GrpE [Campylobacterota bacterium]|nr:nucleotide exchange factor GrpE [Campylobacterota bacterium]
MDRELIKANICKQIDSMDEEQFSKFIEGLEGGVEEEMVSELVSIKGEFKKMTKLITVMQQSLEANNQKKSVTQEYRVFINFYNFLINSQESLMAIDSPSFFNSGKVKEQLRAFKDGYASIELLYGEILESIELKPTAYVGAKFDASIHEIIEVTHEETTKNNEIVEILEQGFIVHDRVLEYAKVKVNQWIS